MHLIEWCCKLLITIKKSKSKVCQSKIKENKFATASTYFLATSTTSTMFGISKTMDKSMHYKWSSSDGVCGYW